MSVTDEQNKTPAVTVNTPVSIGLVIVILAHLAGGIVAYSDLKYRIKGIETQLEAAADDRFRGSQMEAWALRFAVMNQGTRVPDPADPRQLIVIEKAIVERRD